MKEGGKRDAVSVIITTGLKQEQTAIDSMQSIISTAGLTLHLYDPAEIFVSDLTQCCCQFLQFLPVRFARFHQLSAEIEDQPEEENEATFLKFWVSCCAKGSPNTHLCIFMKKRSVQLNGFDKL